MLGIFEKLKENNCNFSEISSSDKAVLITTLLIECAKSDDEFSDKEKNQIKRILQNKLHLDEKEAQDCFQKADENSNESVEIYSLTKDIRNNFSKEEILLIFEYLWKIILSDGIIDDFDFQQRSIYKEIIEYDYGTMPNIAGLGLRIIKKYVDQSRRF